MPGVSLETLHRWKRFAASGTANTIIGCMAIFTVQLITKNAYLSNALGYAIGGVCGYFLHAHYTFKTKTGFKSIVLYSGVVFVSYILNLFSLNLFLSWVNSFLAQFVAVCTYVLVSYVLQSRLVFPQIQRGGSSDP